MCKVANNRIIYWPTSYENLQTPGEEMKKLHNSTERVMFNVYMAVSIHFLVILQTVDRC